MWLSLSRYALKRATLKHTGLRGFFLSVLGVASFVRKLIAGPHVAICDECVEACIDIIKDDDEFEAQGGTIRYFELVTKPVLSLPGLLVRVPSSHSRINGCCSGTLRPDYETDRSEIRSVVFSASAQH